MMRNDQLVCLILSILCAGALASSSILAVPLLFGVAFCINKLKEYD